nr:DUF1045 domain-containing protein [Thalassobius sp. Cn5-15]
MSKLRKGEASPVTKSVSEFKRYAIYYAPEAGDLADFGASWLGWDLAAGAAVDHPVVEGLDVAALTDVPRKYGLHGTVKPPFRLADGMTVEALMEATQAFCATRAPVVLDELQLTSLGRFLALTVQGNAMALNDLAGATVAALDPFRAPLNAAELAKRRQSRLSERQEALLAQWGYPYVMEEFRFHLTMTGKVPKAQLENIRKRMEPLLTPILPRPFVIRDLCLVGEDQEGMFHLIHRYALSG